MGVLLANPPWSVNGIKGVRAGSRWPHLKIPEEEDYIPFPFFLAYAASLLKKNKIDVLLIDAIAEGMNDRKFLGRIKDYKPNIILFEVSTPSLEIDLDCARKIKKLDNSIKIVLSGLDMNIRSPEFLKKNSFIDFVLVGEYEFTLLGLVNCLKNKDNLNKVLGLIYRNKDKIIINKKRPLGDVNKLPWPLREQLPMRKYHDCPGGIPQPSVQVLASRGCPYRCIFCAWPQIMYHGSNYRARDPVDVVDEMEFLVRKKGFKSVYFDDDTFNIGRERMFKICDEIKKRKLNVPWAIMARADLMDKELLDEMKSAGLYAIKYGIESAVQKLVDNANKDLDLKKAEEMIKYTNKIGIKTHLTFMFGLPGETNETIQKTIDFALKMNPESVQFSITTPFPGTSYYKELDKRSMLVSKKWSDYDGNFKSVIKTSNLSSKELENAVRKAYNAWAEHRQKRVKNNNSLIVLKKCLNEHGPKYTARRIISKVFKKKDINKKKQEQREIPKKNLILKKFYDNRLDLIGVVDGKHAFTFPNLIQIDLTNKCNNSCIGCWCNSPLLEEKKISGKEKEATLPYNKVISLIDELKKHGTNEIYLGGGGEPFMHPKIMEIIEYIKTNNLVCHINTNFTLINEKIAKKLVDLDVDHIAVSLWAGDANTYVKTHPNQTKEIFYQIEKILKLIKRLKHKLGKEKPLIKIYDVISSLNYKNIDKMVEFAYKTADSVEFSVIDVVEGKTDILLLNEKQRKKLLKKSLELKEKYKTKRNFIIFRFNQFIKRISNPMSVKGLYDKKAVNSIPCYVGWTFSRILANGNVIPCLKAHKKPMGNILKKNFKEIFFSEKYSKFRFMTKNFKKNNEFFKCINCYKTCDDLGRNNEIHKQMSSLSCNEKEVLNYSKDLRAIKGMTEFLNKREIKTTYYEKEQKKILDNILNWDIGKIKKKINELYEELNKKNNLYGLYKHLGLDNKIYIKATKANSKIKRLTELKKDFELTQGIIDFLNKGNIKTTYYEKEQKKILDNILNWDIGKIKKKINELYNKLEMKKSQFTIKSYYKKLNRNELKKLIKQKFEGISSDLDVLLIICPPWDTKMPPLGLAYIISNLKNKGLKAEVIDMNIELYNRAKKKYKGAWKIENFNDWINRNFHLKLFNIFNDYIEKVLNLVVEKKPLIVGFSINASNINCTYGIIKKLKNLDNKLKICIGGPGTEPSYILSHKIKDYIDIAIIGETEHVIPDIINCNKKNVNFNNILETFISKEGVIFIKTKPLENIDFLVAPTYSEFDLSKYEELILPMLTSRGCINRCNFCVDWMQRRCYSLRSPRKVVEEIEYHIEHNNIRTFNFWDLIINGNLKHLERICDLIVKRDLKIKWSAQGMVNQRMDYNILKKMKSAGCINLVFGVESCSDKVLKLMNKPFRVKDLKIILIRLKKVGITVDINLIIGYPGEGEKEFEETYNFIDKYYNYITCISSLTPCLMMGNSWISRNIKNLGIVVPKDKEGYLKWYNLEHTNTYEIRKKRVKEIIKLSNYHGIKTPLVNLYDESSSLHNKAVNNLNILYPQFNFNMTNKIINNFKRNSKNIMFKVIK